MDRWVDGYIDKRLITLTVTVASPSGLLFRVLGLDDVSAHLFDDLWRSGVSGLHRRVSCEGHRHLQSSVTDVDVDTRNVSVE